MPPCQRASVNHQRNHRAAEVAHAVDPLHAELEALRPVSVAPVPPAARRRGCSSSGFSAIITWAIATVSVRISNTWCASATVVTDPEGKVLYLNAWITDWPITEHSVAALAASGRARWKIEIENNNTLKTKGYLLEHNFGHGQQHLSSLLAAMNLLAFLFHTVLGLTYEHYRLIRATLPTRKTFFQDLHALTRYR